MKIQLLDGSGVVVTTLDGVQDPWREFSSYKKEYPTAVSWSVVEGSVVLPTVLANIRDAKIVELRSLAEQKIYAGFYSTALGSVHLYSAKQFNGYHDQINLIGAVTETLVAQLEVGSLANTTIPFWCATRDGAWARREHTARQIRKVGVDGAASVRSMNSLVASLAALVYRFTEAESIQAITLE